MELSGKTALVLGSIKGIGKGIALELAKQGVRVAANYYDWEDFLPDLKADLDKTKTEYEIFRTNLIETDSVVELLKSVNKRFGSLDILINNIERGGWPILHGAYNQKQWNLELDTTLKAKWWVFNEALPYLKASQNGVVINYSSIASIVGRTGPAGYIFNDGYSSANRAVSLFTETWARQAAPFVRVNEIMLGFIETRHGQYTRAWNLLTDQQKQDIIEHTLLKRTGTIKDVVDTTLFIIKDAPFMTGSIVRLDGGYVLGAELVPEMPQGFDDV